MTKHKKTRQPVTSFTMTDTGNETVNALKLKLGYKSKAEVWHQAMLEFADKHELSY